MSTLTIYSVLPAVFGNVAIDLLGAIFLTAVIAHYFRRGAKTVKSACSTRAKLLGLRETLELKSGEVEALRAALMQLRGDVEEQRKRKTEDDLQRLYLSQLVSHREFDPEHADLEERLQEASRRSTDRFDA